MSLIKTNIERTPLLRSLLTDLFQADNFFEGEILPKSLFAKVPAANIKEDANQYEIELAIPGVSKDKIKINLENDVLEISAEEKQEKNEESKNFTRKEFNYSSFTRSFVLPETVRKEEIVADYKEGVLKLVLPKKELANSNSKKEIKLS